MSSASATPRPINRVSGKRSSLRYDLRRRVLVSNLNRAVSPLTEVKSLLPSKPPSTAPLDLLKDIPTDKRTKQQCTLSHAATAQRQKTPEKKTFRIDPAVLSRNPIEHTPTKAPAKRRFSEPTAKPTMSIHLLREEYMPPTKKDCLRSVVVFNPSAVVEVASGASGQEFVYDSPPTKPVPLPRKSKTSTSSRASSTTSSSSSSSASSSSTLRPESSNSNASEDSEDPTYARIENCRTGSKEDLVKYGFSNKSMTLRQKPPLDTHHVRFLDDCTDGKQRRNSMPTNSAGLRLRPRFASTTRECRAKKSLLFSDGIDSTKAPAGLTVKNVHADTSEETPLKDTISRIQASPEEAAPRILNQSGIYSNNTLVVESKKLKKDEVDKSYGFACRMRPMLRALNGRTPPQLLPSKAEARRKLELGSSPLKATAVEAEAPAKPAVTVTAPPSAPPRPPPRTSPLISPNQHTPAKAAPTKEIAIQTSFVVHGAVDCPQSKGSAKKRRRSMEIIAEVGAKVRRRSSVLRDKLYRSLDITPSK